MRRLSLLAALLAATVLAALLGVSSARAAGSLTINCNLPDPQVGVSYSQDVTASGGTPPYYFGNPVGVDTPPGLSGVSEIDGNIAGTPTTAGVYTYHVDVFDSGSDPIVAATCTMTVDPATVALADAVQGVAYQASLTGVVGQGPYTFADAALSLPLGLSLSPDGTISGTPLVHGSFAVTTTVTSSNGQTVNQHYTLEVTAPVVSGALPNVVAGAPYNEQLSAAGGSGDYTFALSSGALPPGLSFSSAGTLSGAANTAGIYNFAVVATDQNGVTGDPTSYTVSVSRTTLTKTSVSFQAGHAYTEAGALTASSGTAPYSFTVASGALPDGLTLNSDGSFSGTPTVDSASPFAVDVKVTDQNGVSDTETVSVTVVKPSLSVATVSHLSVTYLGADYSLDLAALLQPSGGAAPYHFALSAGNALPPGLALSDAGTISGTPTTTGTYTFALTMTDSTSTIAGSAAEPFRITVRAPTITTLSLPAAQVGQPYSSPALSVSGGTAPYSFTVASGALPAGLTLASVDGSISGTPTAGGSFSLSVAVADANSAGSSQYYSFAVAAPTIVVDDSAVTSLEQGLPVDAQLAATGATAPYSFTVSTGSLPDGLSLSPDGVLSGTPTGSGNYDFTVQATDSSTGSGPYTGTIEVTGAIAAAPQLATKSLKAGEATLAYSDSLSLSGGTTPYGVTVSAGALPPGVDLGDDGSLSGTPTAPGSFDFTATLTDALGGQSSASYEIVVVATPQIDTASLADGLLGTAYSETLAASAGSGGYSFALSSGALPTGLSLAADGALAGTPTVDGSFSFTVVVTDSAGATASRSYTLVVSAPIVLEGGPATGALPDATDGGSVHLQLAAAGGIGPYSFALGKGSSLPAGLSLSSAGLLSGTPTKPGDYSFSVVVTDANGASVVETLTLRVAAQPASQPSSPSTTPSAPATPTADTQSPSAPAKPRLELKHGYHLVWQASHDDRAVAGYRVYQGDKLLGDVKQPALAFAPWRLIKPGQTATLRVLAYDAAGNLSTPLLLTVHHRLRPQTPHVIPTWAFKLDAWRATPLSKRHQRPSAPRLVPGWYWGWALWHQHPFVVRVVS